MGVSSAVGAGVEAGDGLLGVDGVRAVSSGWACRAAAFSASRMETRSRSSESEWRSDIKLLNMQAVSRECNAGGWNEMVGAGSRCSLTRRNQLSIDGMLLLSIANAAEVFLSPVGGHGVCLVSAEGVVQKKKGECGAQTERYRGAGIRV